MITSAVDTSIQLTSPLLGTGADAAAAAAGACADAAAAVAGSAAGAAVAAAADAAGAGWSAATDTPAKPRAASPRAREAMSFFMGCLSGLRTSEGVLAGFARANANDLFQRRDEDLPVADLAGAGRCLDRLDDLV